MSELVVNKSECSQLQFCCSFSYFKTPSDQVKRPAVWGFYSSCYVVFVTSYSAVPGTFYFWKKQSPAGLYKDSIRAAVRILCFANVPKLHDTKRILKDSQTAIKKKKTSYCGRWDPWTMSPQPIQLGKLLKNSNIFSMTLTHSSAMRATTLSQLRDPCWFLMSQQGVSWNFVLTWS